MFIFALVLFLETNYNCTIVKIINSCRTNSISGFINFSTGSRNSFILILLTEASLKPRGLFYFIIMNIALLGSKNSFHHQAATSCFGNSIQIISCNSFEEIVQSVLSGKAESAWIAIENSTAGSILSNYTLLHESNLKIQAEYAHQIDLSLLTKPGTSLHELKYIYSHPMAFKQCKLFLQKLSNVKLIEVEDTSKAVQLLLRKNKPQSAAIASDFLCEEMGLTVLQKSIQSNSNNFTRFFLLGKNQIESIDHNKASLTFRLIHQVGSLADVLTELKYRQYNLSKIQSMPVVGNPGLYRFYIDVDYPLQGSSIDLEQILQNFATEIKILGCYSKKY